MVLNRVLLQADCVILIAAPLFLTWGIGQLQLVSLLHSTVALTHHFDPTATLDLVERHRVDTLAAVPVLLQGLVNLVIASRNLSPLRVVTTASSAIPTEVVMCFLDTFDDMLYNVCGFAGDDHDPSPVAT